MPPGIGYGPPGMNGGGGGGMPAPMGSTAPAAGRPDMGGMKVRAGIMADLGMKALMEAAKLAGPRSPEGLNLIKAIELIAKSYPEPPSADLTQQEVKLLASRAQPAQMGDPSQGASSLLAKLGQGGMQPPAA